MTDKRATKSEQINHHLKAYFSNFEETPVVEVSRSGGKSFTVTLSSKSFQKMPLAERERVFQRALDSLDPALRKSIGLYLLYDPEEYAEIQAMLGLSVKPYQQSFPFWSDVLLSGADSEHLTSSTRNHPLVVTFYSFKGGVGRSTSLAMVARDLAVNHKLNVVVVDFDLEAPGLGTLFPDDQYNRKVKYGVLDYLHQRWIDSSATEPSIADCIQSIDLGSRRGRLYVIDAGQFDENYVHRLADLDVESMYQRRGRELLEQFQSDIVSQVNPDVILIDARTGFNRLGGIAVLDLAHLVVLCLSPNIQGRQGTHWVVAAIQNLQKNGRPDLTYRFALTPFPATNAEGQQSLLAEMEGWFEEHRPLNGDDLLTSELYTRIDYDARVPLLTHLRGTLPDDLVTRYGDLTNFINGAIDQTLLNLKQGDIEPSLNRRIALHELHFDAPVASDISEEDLEFIFQRTEDFDSFVDDRTALIRGAKGTGKTMLFRLFVDFPNRASILSHRQNTQFIGIHGQKNDTMDLKRNSFRSIMQQIQSDQWNMIWQAYIIIRLWHNHQQNNKKSFPLLGILSDVIPKLRAEQSDIVQKLIQITNEPGIGPFLYDQFYIIDNWLTNQGESIWLMFDELDTIINDRKHRSVIVRELLSCWLEFQHLHAIKWKFFVREDVWRSIASDMTNSSHFTGHDVRLSWQENDLWRLVLRQALRSKEFSRAALIRGINIKNLDESDLILLRQGITLLCGDRMSGSNTAYTYRWIMSRITDTQDNSFPRSLIILLNRSLQIENDQRQIQSTPAISPIIRPSALQRALPEMSQERVNAIGDEYENVPDWLKSLSGTETPIAYEDLKERWKIDDDQLEERINLLTEAGVLKLRERERTPQVSKRYTVAELYRAGIGMKLRGPGGTKGIIQ